MTGYDRCRTVFLAAALAAGSTPSMAWDVKGGDAESRVAELQNAWQGDQDSALVLKDKLKRAGQGKPDWVDTEAGRTAGAGIPRLFGVGTGQARDERLLIAEAETQAYASIAKMTDSGSAAALRGVFPLDWYRAKPGGPLFALVCALAPEGSPGMFPKETAAAALVEDLKKAGFDAESRTGTGDKPGWLKKKAWQVRHGGRTFLLAVGRSDSRSGLRSRMAEHEALIRIARLQTGASRPKRLDLEDPVILARFFDAEEDALYLLVSVEAPEGRRGAGTRAGP